MSGPGSGGGTVLSGGQRYSGTASAGVGFLVNEALRWNGSAWSTG